MSLRTYTDAQGGQWSVFEVSPQELRTGPAQRYAAPGLCAGWLSFKSAAVSLRLAPFPRNWDLLSDDELQQLCRLAHPVDASRESPATR